ncbi:replicative DNA helicase Mcm [Halovenus aranensis]|uniref:DNA helicase n=1 Tax=Halovenus aranensis TaxID=890420 RepID=A0A1G8TJ65_9EURY|nr:LAGLIDADG family homing endonuclease [Halovenus aranensis]SDJ41646.1 replicative DNA helicase Mcm [Halovenus aranensis]
MARADNTELIDTFEEFYRSYYRNEIGELAQKYPNEQKSLYIDWGDLYRFDPAVADDFRNKPEQLREYAEEALRLYDLPVDVSLGQAHVRVTGLPNQTDIREIRADHRGMLIAIQGIVRKATDVRPKITTAAFECQRCGTLSRIPQEGGDFQEPHECQGCERQGPFRINYDQSEFIDAQKLRVQESPEGLRGGETPQSVDIDIEDDITGEVTAGDHVQVTGVLKLDQQGSEREKSAMFDFYMDGMTVEIEDEQFEEMDITDEDKTQIIELSNEPDIYEQMEQSIAPSIYGYQKEKRAMIFQLFSGVTKHLPDGSRTRGDLHMLLIGDPGTGKCMSGEEYIWLADGSRVKIGEFVENNLDDPVEIDDGYYSEIDVAVPSLSEDGTVSERNATKVWKREAPEKMYRVRTARGRGLEVTPSHPLFVQKGGQFTAERAEELDEGDFVATPAHAPSGSEATLDVEYRSSKANNAVTVDLPDVWTPWLARLIGYIVAEGYVELDEENSGSVRITNADEEIRSDVKHSYERLGVPYSEYEGRDRTPANVVRCSASEFVRFLEQLEPKILETSEQQRVPEAILRAPEYIQSAFLKAYIDSEGHVSTNERELTVASKSEGLLEDVRLLLCSAGIDSSLKQRQNDSYRLRISGRGFETYVSSIGFVTRRKSEAASEHAPTPQNTNTDVVPGVGDLLRKVRGSLCLTQSECGLPRSTYQHYERGDRNPSRQGLTTVIDSFEERIEWLQQARKRVGDGDWSELESVRAELNISQCALAAGMDVTQGAISYHERNDVAPDGGQVEDARAVVSRKIDEALSVTGAVERLRRLAEADVRWDSIESIEAVEPDYDWVYDLEVAGTHNYISNGIVSHNSAMLQYVKNIAPRSVYTSGKGSSSAGLTAAAVRDDFGDGQQWTLEAGALVLADQGIAAVDELDKMRSEDQSAMHEALEQQSYHPDTEVLLSDGRRVEIGEFVDEKMAARPDDVVDGVDCEILPVEDIGVHTVDFESNEVEKQPVDRVSRHKAPDKFVRVTFSNGRSVLVTPEHPMFVDDEGQVGTVEARDIDEGAFVPAPRKLPNSTQPVELTPEQCLGKEKDVELPEQMSADLAEILGLLTAEGHSYAGSAHEIGFSNQDERLLSRAAELMGNVFGIESTDTTNAAGTVTKRWVSTKLYRWFQENVPELMHTARDKRIPTAVLGASEEEIRRFLVGAFAGDGGVESEAMAFSTASAGLARDYADALSKIGVASRIHRDTAENTWKVYVMGDSTERFVERVVQQADDRYEDAQAFVERSNETPRHHDVLPTSAAREIRELRRLLGLRLTGNVRPHLDEGFGVRVETVEAELTKLHERLAEIREDLTDATTLSEVRTAIGWSARNLAERIGETTSTVHYAEDGGYDANRRDELTDVARETIEAALTEFERRADALERRCDLRYYRVTDVETVSNEGEYDCDWVYDVTVEPTNTFVSEGVVLHNSISVSKAGINATLKSRCSLLGAANPTYGRFDQYEPIGEQIDLEPPLISRFDLIFTVTDDPNEEKDAELAEHILKTNYAGELNTHREHMTSSEYTEEEVENVTEDVAPTIDAELLRKYVAYAKRTCYPTMTEEAKSRIQDFYVQLRSRGADEDAAVPVTARKLEALVRLAEASARVRLSDTVEKEDAERATAITRYCLEDIGMDPETGEFDADVIETGTSKSQRDRIKNIKHLISTIEDEYDEGAPVDVIIERAEEEGIETSKAEHEIEKLKQKGEVYEPRTDHLRTT